MHANDKNIISPYEWKMFSSCQVGFVKNERRTGVSVGCYSTFYTNATLRKHTRKYSIRSFFLTRFRSRKSGLIMKRFLEGYNLVKNPICFKLFYGSRDHPLGDIFHSNISAIGPVRGKIFLLGPLSFLSQGHIVKCFGPFGTRIYITYTEFLGSKRVAKKTKIWCHALDFMSFIQRPWLSKQVKGDS